ncbi:MAG: 23S rRNA (adenine(2503)-C(2))-methyltransferase RlmN [Patescibacteria group bacterium]
MIQQELQKAIDVCGEKPFRLKQAERAIFTRLISDWSEATDLPDRWRTYLQEHVPLSVTREISRGISSRGDSTKVLLQLTDGEAIECVLMRHEKGRNTVCVSSQAGCPMRCAFCATGRQGFKRNLTAQEIVEQVLHFARELRKENERVSNVVFMGMGEPFHNYDEVLRAINVLNAKDGLNISARKISVSTCGIVPGIRRLAAEPLQLNLAISLHAPNDRDRSALMPVNDAYSIDELLREVERYVEQTNRKVMFEYLLIDGVNDTYEHAEQLVKLLGHHPLYHINLIRYHRTGKFVPSPKEQREAFHRHLRDRGLVVTHRVSFGEDIQAACGMLAGQQK